MAISRFLSFIVQPEAITSECGVQILNLFFVAEIQDETQRDENGSYFSHRLRIVYSLYWMRRYTRTCHFVLCSASTEKWIAFFLAGNASDGWIVKSLVCSCRRRFQWMARSMTSTGPEKVVRKRTRIVPNKRMKTAAMVASTALLVRRTHHLPPFNVRDVRRHVEHHFKSSSILWIELRAMAFMFFSLTIFFCSTFLIMYVWNVVNQGNEFIAIFFLHISRYLVVV